MSSNITTHIPPLIQARHIDTARLQQALTNKMHPLQARIIASRPAPEGTACPIMPVLHPSLKFFVDPVLLLDMAKGASRVATAICKGEVIAIETDHDCDGQTSHAVLYTCLQQHFGHPPEKLQSFIGHRLTEGYGLSDAVANRILAAAPQPSLVITADNGSSDELRIARLKAAGIDVVITDHHSVPLQQLPNSAYAFINPNRPDCTYPDKYIAGCMVAWLLMCATRQQLINLGHLPADSAKLLDVLDYVAVGTIADCVSLARSVHNRALIQYGLQLLNRWQRPCWQALQAQFTTTLTAEDVAFRLAPLLNSDGRLSSAFAAVNFLLLQDKQEAIVQLKLLQQQNQQRKQIQADLVQQCLQHSSAQLRTQQFSLCLYLEQGHVGVHGIAASKLRERFGRPTAVFSHKTAEILTGSVRTIDGFHVRQGLQYIAEQAPALLLAFGGHQGAGGVSIYAKDFSTFAELFEAAVAMQLTSVPIAPIIYTDGWLEAHELSATTLKLIDALEPFGREFERPLFQTQANISAFKLMGDGTHVRLTLQIGPQQQVFTGIWFGFRDHGNAPLPFTLHTPVELVFTPKWGQQGKCELHIQVLR